MITTIITDFDGTLVDTFEANLRAYQQAFNSIGKELKSEDYKECFGLRFDAFMSHMKISDERITEQIREAKAKFYPKNFEFLRPNEALIALIDTFHEMGGKTAIASTARKENLMNAVTYLGISGAFDMILAGIDVKEGKPSPEIYIKAMESLGATPSETLIFEDSEVGLEAAKASGAKYIKIKI
jgi:HAD superfamily hydrolase (TIGR01509 family)